MHIKQSNKYTLQMKKLSFRYKAYPGDQNQKTLISKIQFYLNKQAKQAITIKSTQLLHLIFYNNLSNMTEI